MSRLVGKPQRPVFSRRGSYGSTVSSSLSYYTISQSAFAHLTTIGTNHVEMKRMLIEWVVNKTRNPMVIILDNIIAKTVNIL